jgi:hypothetical protein
MVVAETPTRGDKMTIKLMGKFTAVGTRQRIDDPTGLVINTCSGNDRDNAGDPTHWNWCNPTNQAILHHYEDVVSVSPEALWQGCKLMQGQGRPDPLILAGAWKKNKGKRPMGAYAGPGLPLITDPGQARRTIYIPAYRALVDHWIHNDDEVADWVVAAMNHDGRVYLRDHDTGRGLDRDGPLSHAWILAYRLNKGDWPN